LQGGAPPQDPLCTPGRPGGQGSGRRIREGGGFTLIEVSVVVFIMAILFLMAAPRLQENLFSDPQGKTYRWLSGALRDLRRKAQADGAPWDLVVDLDTQSLWSEQGSGTPDGRAAPPAGRFPLPEGLVLNEVETAPGGTSRSGRAAIRFQPQGVSHMAVLRFRTRHGETWSLLVEPFLSGVKVFDRALSLAESR
jgi:prepilin-type N-terminal cleavage/methylation domain-containing protein